MKRHVVACLQFARRAIQPWKVKSSGRQQRLRQMLSRLGIQFLNLQKINRFLEQSEKNELKAVVAYEDVMVVHVNTFAKRFIFF